MNPYRCEAKAISACNFIQGIKKLPISLIWETDSIFTQDVNSIKIITSLKSYSAKNVKLIWIYKVENKDFVHYKESN